MKKNSQDLIVGAVIIAALFILVFSVLYLKELSLTSKRVHYTVLFPDISTLQLGDPVTVSGVKKGRVLTIAIENDQVACDIELEKSITLTDSCTITVQNIGLMGERMVGIQLSPRGTVYLPSTKQKRTLIYGRFDTGIGEAMGMLGTVLSEVLVVIKNVESIMDSTIADTSFLRLYKNVTGRLDTLTLVAQQLATRDAPKINNAVDNLQSISLQMQQLVTANKQDLETIVQNGANLSTRAIDIAESLDSITTSLSGMVSDIKNGKGSIGKLVNDEVLYKDIKSSMGKLDTLLTETNDKGLKLRLYISGFGSGKKK